MFRRKFLSTAVPAALTSVLPLMANQNMKAHKYKKLIVPRPLREGGTVALVAPSSPPSAAKFDKAFGNLVALGFKVKPGPNMRQVNGYLAGTDAERAADLMQAFQDPEVEAIWCVRGGYGCTRLLHLLDYKIIRKNPKPLIGYSDITALHLALYQHAGLQSYHGQVGGGDMTSYTITHLRSVFMNRPHLPFPIDAFGVSLQRDADYVPYTIQPGMAEGPLTGGNLTLLASLCGTPFAPRFKDHIVFIEEVGEAPYRIDRLLTTLLHGSDLREACGIVLGVFTDCVQKGDTPTLTTRECLQDRLGNLGIPIYYGAPFGHVSDQCVFPYGHVGRMDAEKWRLELVD